MLTFVVPFFSSACFLKKLQFSTHYLLPGKKNQIFSPFFLVQD